VAYHEVDRLYEADDIYAEAWAACRRCADDPDIKAMLPILLHNRIDILQELGEHGEARYLMLEAYKVLPEDQYGAHIRNQRAIWALHQGDLQAALLWAESGLGHPTCDDRTRAALLLVKAKIALAMGEPPEAQTCAQEAARLAVASRSWFIAARVSRFMKLM